MQNINELIGIIKGIDFDGVINNKEVLRLQSWVDKNRNLAYDKKQIELIKMVDAVLEDHVIDDSEKEMMITACEEYLKASEDNTSRIYELNGIIEGIVCDGEVNEAEVWRLKEWMDAYGESIRDHKTSVELCKAIDDILADGVVTEEEQAELLMMLSDRINNAQFEIKLEYLCKLVKERKNIGVDLIDILNNESAMKSIHNRAERNLMQAVSSYSGYCRDSEIIVVSLVLIAMLEYNGNYYDTANGKVKYVLPCYNKCIMDEEKTEILCMDNPKMVKITPVFHGKNKVFYELFNSAGDKILTSKLLDSAQTSTLKNLKSFQEYTIRFHEKTKILQLRKNTLLLEKQRIFYYKEDFVGRSFKIRILVSYTTSFMNICQRMN